MIFFFFSFHSLDLFGCTDKSDKFGTWSVSGTSLVIGKNSGTGVAVSVGTSVVYCNIDGVVLFTEVRKSLYKIL